MLGYLEIDDYKKGVDGVEIALVKEEKNGQFSSWYHKTAKQIFGLSKSINGIVIPYNLEVKYNYDVLLMILHIRLFSDEDFSQMPIVVYIDSSDHLKDFTENHSISEKVYNSIGVSIALYPLSDGVKLYSVDTSKKLEKFLKEKAGHPRPNQGRHDQANRWGPYVFLSVLNEVFGDCSDALQDVENEMFEEPYLKWLANGIGERSGLGSLEIDLKSAQHRLNTQLNNLEHKKILIVEDKLEDGWRHVYEEVFDVEGLDIEIIWAQTKEEARDHFKRELAFVILDMRLANDVVTEDNPTGIKLAKEFREEQPAVPIIVATASNKSWVLQELTDEGIDAYWVKASPEIDLDFSHAAKNVLDFYKKVESTLEWSSKTRNWIESLYHVAEVVTQTDSLNGKLLKEKAQSFHALMQHSFTPFSREISKGLQRNLAFLIAYSCMNDLVSWIIIPDKDQKSNLDVWYMKVDGARKELVRQRKNEKGKIGYEMYNDSAWKLDFPDRRVAVEVLGRYRLSKQEKKFQQMSSLRNGLPLIHGKNAELKDTSKHVDSIEDKQLSDIIEILSDLINKHSKQ